jgi:enhancing lycopene biosynthesis protein 2
MEKIGVRVVMKTKTEIVTDASLKLVTAPCYMMEASIVDVRTNTAQLVKAVLELIG